MSRFARMSVAAVAALALVATGLPSQPGPVAAISTSVVISQVYGGGGNSGGVYTNDFVELFNRGTSPASLATGTQLETRPRYTPTTCFETFPFPRPADEQREAIAAAARELVRLRDGWLNPPGLDPAALAIRTLTNLYNQRPSWLSNAHATLDGAVLAAYGWPFDLTNPEILERLLALNLGREPA